MDRLNREQRSRNMARVKGKNTKPEMQVRGALHAMGYRFRLHRKDLPGKPDIVLPKHRTAIFVHGCFWHQHEGCHKSARPVANAEFWEQKLSGNMQRDKEKQEGLRLLGWRVLVIWQCEIDKSQDLKVLLTDKLNQGKPFLP